MPTSQRGARQWTPYTNNGRGGSRGRASRTNTSRGHSSISSSESGRRTTSKKPSTEWHSAQVARRVSLASRPRASQSSSRATTTAPISRRQQAEDDESLEHVVLAIDVKDRGTVGCAYYVAREERLFCMEDVVKSGHDIIERLKVDLEPTVVLVSTRVDGLSERGSVGPSLASHDEDNDRTLPYEIELRPSPEFSHHGGLNRLSGLPSVQTSSRVHFLVPGNAEEVDDVGAAEDVGLSREQGSLMHISGCLDLDCKVGIGCVGAVMAYLQRKRASDYLQDDSDAQLAYCISGFDMFSLKNTMLVNADTLSSLQIIMPETHPNAFNQGPGAKGSKESLSVFGLFHDFARTPQGKVRLRQLFLRPSLDVEEISPRLDFVTLFTRPDNQTQAAALSKSLSKIKNLRGVMTNLRKGVEAGKKYGSFKSGVWCTLLEFCYYAIDVVDSIREVAGSEQLLVCSQVCEIVDKFRFMHIGKAIHDVVDLELSQEQSRTVVKRGVNEGLDQVKDAYDGMDDILSQVAIEVARSMPVAINCRINVIFFPQLGFHITVPIDEDTLQPIWEGDGTWERMFTTRNIAYFKETKMRQMDQELGDLWAGICDVEIEIVHDLAQRVLESEQLLIRSSDVLGELDCLLALAHGAAVHKLVRPRFVEDNIIAVRGGRHPLQEMVVPSYVPNDTSIRGGNGVEQQSATDAPSVVILTGPNFSGKSVYQNQVAIIVYMAQIGCFVPADHCILGITDKILTRITTTETVSKLQSAFMIDLQQIALALNSCTCRSLVIIDEFGKGTDTCDGAGLAAGVLQHLLELGSNCPKVLAATHFHEIFELGLFEDEAGLAMLHMEVRVDKRSVSDRSSGEPAEEVTYLYQLQEGRSTLSYGAQCAAMNGVPGPVVGRAVELADYLAKGQDLVVLCSAMSAAEMEDLETAEIVSRQFLSLDLDGSQGEDPGEEVAEGHGLKDVLAAILVVEEAIDDSSDATVTELSEFTDSK